MAGCRFRGESWEQFVSEKDDPQLPDPNTWGKEEYREYVSWLMERYSYSDAKGGA